MGDAAFMPEDGACACAQVRFRLLAPPLFVHCCHCTWCQRETGSAFALNALVETAQIERLQGDAETVPTPSASGRGQKIVRCPRCRVALWSHYAGAGDAIAFVRVGTLARPARFPPDIHIYTLTKLPWLTLADGAAVVAEYYRREDRWPAHSLERFRRACAP